MTSSIRRATGPSAAHRMAPLLSLLSLAVLAGCNGLFHSDARPEQVYFLRAKAVAPAEAARTPIEASVRVGQPIAAPGLESPQIMLVESDRRMSFYSGSRWPAPVPDVVESLAVETLRSSGSWTSVGDSTSPFPSDYQLQITVRRFEADYTSGERAPQVHVILDCIVGRREGRDVIASFVAEGSAAAGANKLSEVVAAFETAANIATASVSEQTLRAVHSAMEHKAAGHR